MGQPSVARFYQLVPPAAPGGTWTYNVLAEVGNYMTSALTMDAKGNLYGTTQQTGHYNAGLVFGLIRPTTAGDPWTQVDIYSFKSGSDGFTPVSGLTLKSGVTLWHHISTGELSMKERSTR